MIKAHFKRQGIKLAMPTRNMVISKKKKNKNKTKNNNRTNNEVKNTHNEPDVPKTQWSAEIEISMSQSLASKEQKAPEKYDVESQIDI